MQRGEKRDFHVNIDTRPLSRYDRRLRGKIEAEETKIGGDNKTLLSKRSNACEPG